MVEIIKELIISELVLPILTTIGLTITSAFSYIAKNKLSKNSDDFKVQVDTINSNLNLLKDSVKEINDVHKKETIRFDFLKQSDKIINEACNYTSDILLRNFIMFKGEKIRDTAYDFGTIYPNINDINLDFLTKTFDKLKKEIQDNSTSKFDLEFTTQLNLSSSHSIEKLESDIIDLIKDEILNNKTRRFFLLIETFLAKNLSNTIRVYNKYSTK